MVLRVLHCNVANALLFHRSLAWNMSISIKRTAWTGVKELWPSLPTTRAFHPVLVSQNTAIIRWVYLIISSTSRKEIEKFLSPTNLSFFAVPILKHSTDFTINSINSDFSHDTWNCVRLICVSDDVFRDSANDCKGKHYKWGLKINKGMYICVVCKFNMGLSLFTLSLVWCPKRNIYITIQETTKFPFQGSLAYILLSGLFILEWKAINYLFN